MEKVLAPPIFEMKEEKKEETVSFNFELNKVSEMKKVNVSVISPEVFSPHMSDVDEEVGALSNM